MGARSRRGAVKKPSVGALPSTNARQTNQQKAVSSLHERSEVVKPEIGSIKDEEVKNGKGTRKLFGQCAVGEANEELRLSVSNVCNSSEEESRLSTRRTEERKFTSKGLPCSRGNFTTVAKESEVLAATVQITSVKETKEQSVNIDSKPHPSFKMSNKIEVEKAEQIFTIHSEPESETSGKQKGGAGVVRQAPNLNTSCNAPSINEQEALPKVPPIPPWAVHVDDKAVDENCPSSMAVKEVHLQSARSFGKPINDGERPPSPTINTKMAMQEVDDMFNTTLPMERLCKQDMTSNKSASKTSKPKTPTIEVFMDPSDPKSSKSQPLPSTPIPGKPREVGDEDFQGRENFVQTASQGGSVSKSAVSEKRILQPLFPVTDSTTQNDENIKSLDENDAMLDTGSHPRDMDGDIVPKLNNKPEDVVVFDEGFVKCEVEKGDDDIPKLIDFFVKWTSNEPTFKLLKNDDPESFEDMFDLEPEIGRLVTLGPYTICNGASKRSIVVFAEDLNNVFNTFCDVTNTSEDSDEEEYPLVAVKVSDPNNIWELYIYRELERRLEPQQLSSIPRAISFFEGRGRSYLVLNTVGIATLAEAVQISGNEGLLESVSMIIAADLLRTIEHVHMNGVVHNDVTMDNVIVRTDGSEMDIQTVYNADPNHGWRGRGILLVDFNRAIDTQHWRVGGTDPAALVRYTKKEGDEFRHSDYRPSQMDGWGFNIDCYGVAVCVSKMLKVSLQDLTERPLKHAAIWRKLFGKMTSFGSHVRAEETVESMQDVRKDIETVLASEESLLRYFTIFTNKLEEINSKREEDNILWK